MRILISTLIAVVALSVHAEEVYLEDLVNTDPVTPAATQLSASLNLMTSRDASHFGGARNWLSQNLDEVSAQLEYEFGGVRMRVGGLAITADGKGWDVLVLARPILVGDRDGASVACVAWLAEIKERMGYTMAGAPNGQQIDFDGNPVGLVQLAHRHSLDFKIPASSQNAAYSQAGFVEAKSWLRVRVPYRSNEIKDLTCSNRLNRSSVQISG